MGHAQDPDFEQHLKEGKYFVLDDVALDEYEKDPRVTFILGSSIGDEMMSVIMQLLGIGLPRRRSRDESPERLAGKVAVSLTDRHHF
jgi:hypothetical protein